MVPYVPAPENLLVHLLMRFAASAAPARAGLSRPLLMRTARPSDELPTRPLTNPRGVRPPRPSGGRGAGGRTPNSRTAEQPGRSASGGRLVRGTDGHPAEARSPMKTGARFRVVGIETSPGRVRARMPARACA